MVAQFVRQYTDRAVRASHDGLCAVRTGAAARDRRGAVTRGRAVIGCAWWLFGAVTLQATLGILTLLNQVPIDLALTHQAIAIVVLTLATLQVERLAARRTESAQPKLAVPVGQPG